MNQLRVCHMNDKAAFAAFCRDFREERSDLRFGRIDMIGQETNLSSDSGGMKVFWIYEGEGEVFLPKGFRSKEGDGHALPAEYIADPMEDNLSELLSFLDAHLDDLADSAKVPVQAILSRRRNGAYVGDYANDLWKLEHAPETWSRIPEVVDAIQRLFGLYREQGYSTKTVGSFERIMAGDQLIAAGGDVLRVRGRFSCLTLEKTDRATSHIPSVMRLRYLRDSSGGCNFDFDPFRRLPLTWYMNLPGETGDGLNFVNSHVVNIARETSPTHFHPPTAVGGGFPQNELYLVLDPQLYGLKTYGRQASIVVFPDLHDLNRYEEHLLEPGSFVFIPAGMGHRGMDVFVNVITIPGFKPQNEYYIDQEIFDVTNGTAPHNDALRHLKNYADLADRI